MSSPRHTQRARPPRRAPESPASGPSDLEAVHAAVRLEDLRTPPGNRLEALAGDGVGQHSIRINDQFRICFRWHEGAENVEIVDYHKERAIDRRHRDHQSAAAHDPGEMLREEFLEPLGLSAGRVAKACGVPHTRIERIMREELGISDDTAVRLGRFFGTSPEFWVNLQARYEVLMAEREAAEELTKIVPFVPA
jgi:antitoxin HigA-1